MCRLKHAYIVRERKERKSRENKITIEDNVYKVICLFYQIDEFNSLYQFLLIDLTNEFLIKKALCS
jgi:hypothetical protein